MRGMPTMMINIMDHEIFARNIDTFKEVSKDNSTGHDEYMTHSDIRVVNFDKVKAQYANGLADPNDYPASVDAVAVLNNKFFLVEFKNGSIGNDKSLRKKIPESLLILCDIIKCNISDTRKEWELILVYNEKKNVDKFNNKISSDKIKEHLFDKTADHYIRFGLDRYKYIYFKDVYTYTEKEFDEFLSKSLFRNFTNSPKFVIIKK